MLAEAVESSRPGSLVSTLRVTGFNCHAREYLGHSLLRVTDQWLVTGRHEQDE